MPTSFSQKNTTLEQKVQELLEMFRYGQITDIELVCQGVEIGLKMSKEIMEEITSRGVNHG